MRLLWSTFTPKPAAFDPADAFPQQYAYLDRAGRDCGAAGPVLWADPCGYAGCVSCASLPPGLSHPLPACCGRLRGGEARGNVGTAAATRGGAAGARSAHKAGAGGPEGRPAPALVWLAGGPEAPPASQTPPPPRDAAVSCYLTGSPPYFPSVTHHTPKAFWKPPKAVSKAEPFAALGEAPLTPFASPGAAHAPSTPHFRPATSQGSGGGAAPSRGPGARPPLAVAEPISICASAPAFLSDLAQTLLLRHEKGPANAGPFDLLFFVLFTR